MSKKLIDINKFESLCKVAMKQSIMPFAEKYQHIFAHQYDNAHPTSKSIGNSVQTYIQILQKDIQLTDTSIRIPIGMIADAPQYIRSRAHVLQDGTGQIWSNPGQQVYGDDWRNKHKSNAQIKMRYPDLEHDAQNVVQNVYKIAKSQSKKWSETAFRDTISYIIDHIKQCVEG